METRLGCILEPLLHRALYIKSVNAIPLGSLWDFIWNSVRFNAVCFTWSPFNSFHCLFDRNSEISCQRATLLSNDHTYRGRDWFVPFYALSSYCLLLCVL
jgi:hypothetical protein